MRAVMISIHPKWCGLIFSGRKTIEVRKTRPKMCTPFKCYIYETQAKCDVPQFVDEDGHVDYKGRGQIIGEFVCDEIYEWKWEPDACEEAFDGDMAYNILTIIGEQTGLEYDEIVEYGAGKTLYGWHISGLMIYDEPKELSDFAYAGICPYNSKNGCGYKLHCFRAGEQGKGAHGRCGEYLSRPPQSWMYVEELA